LKRAYFTVAILSSLSFGVLTEILENLTLLKLIMLIRLTTKAANIMMAMKTAALEICLSLKQILTNTLREYNTNYHTTSPDCGLPPHKNVRGRVYPNDLLPNKCDLSI
jgi:hypothetical protein